MGTLVAREPFGRLEEVGHGLYAFISTPLSGDYTTVCNGGIILGDSGILVVEAFQTPEGGRWMAEKARDLGGRWPTHVLVTHYHGDHSSGVEGFDTGPGSFPRLLSTALTRDLRAERLPEDASPALRARWADVVLVAQDAPSELDLGGRIVHFTPREGHTASDVTVDLPEDDLTWCGDLMWNGMFPNYMDAVPSLLSRAVRRIQSRNRRLYVPGHGPLADAQDFSRYVEVLQGVEETARRALRQGWTAEEAANRHRIPPALGEWTLFNPSYFQRAIEAWLTEWS